MDDIAKLAAGLASAPTAWMLALALGAVFYLFRQLSIERAERLAMIIAQESAHRETLMKVLPIADKLTDAMVVVEKLTEIALRKDK